MSCWALVGGSGFGYLLLFPDLSAILSLELEVPSSLAEFLMNSKQRYYGELSIVFHNLEVPDSSDYWFNR